MLTITLITVISLVIVVLGGLKRRQRHSRYRSVIISGKWKMHKGLDIRENKKSNSISGHPHFPNKL